MINTHKKEGQKKWHRQDKNNYHEVEEDAFNALKRKTWISDTS